MQELWSAVDDGFAERLAPADPQLEAVLAANARAGPPPHDVAPLQGRLLHLLVRLTRATRVLEIGALGGYSTIRMARALAPGGRIVTLEADARHAEAACANLARCGVADRVDVRVGRALDLLPSLADACASGHVDARFDLIFIDADKPSNPDYLAWA